MIQRFRVPLGFLVAVGVLVLASPTRTSIALGLPVALGGGVFRMMAAGVIRKDSSLATDGPYAWTRNPLYFGSFLLALGFAIMSARLIPAGLLLIPSAAVYPVVIRREEAHLERLFPDEYRAYRSKVPTFLPRFQNAGLSFSFGQYIKNREYNTAIGFAAALSILIAKCSWRSLVG
jgi:protein-S-isoprenylcysteine O-methyltransferase Ste14